MQDAAIVKADFLSVRYQEICAFLNVLRSKIRVGGRVPQLSVVKTASGEVSEQHTECDREHQERLVLLFDRQIEQDEGKQYHNDALPAVLCSEPCEARRGGERFYGINKYFHASNFLSVCSQNGRVFSPMPARLHAERALLSRRLTSRIV
ncbi:unknown [Eubacterium sp. CAG:786]|nr:unknown [Eubacterium sp. CAG:786]